MLLPFWQPICLFATVLQERMDCLRPDALDAPGVANDSAVVLLGLPNATAYGRNTPCFFAILERVAVRSLFVRRS